MNEQQPLSQDEMIKNLIRDYPEDALEFFRPEVMAARGRPTGVSFEIQEAKKHSHYDPNIKNDIAVIYTFADGGSMVLVLIEHWSSKDKFDIHRVAQYLIDLDYRFPGCEKLPVVMFTDDADVWKTSVPAEIVIRCMDTVYLTFKYQLVRMKAYEAAQYRDTKNRFVAVLRSAMKYDRAQKIFLMLEFLENYNQIEKDVKKIDKNAVIIEYFLKLTDPDREKIGILLQGGERDMTVIEMYKAKVREEAIREGMLAGKEAGMLEGKLEGKIEGKIETAKNMLSEGIDIQTIAKCTGLSVGEIEGLRN